MGKEPKTLSKWAFPMSRRTLLRWIAAFGWLTSFLVQTGSLSSLDSSRRLRATHSYWTSEPPVMPSEYPEFGVPGLHGQLKVPYGMGQSVVMLPGDIIGTVIADRMTPNPTTRTQMAALIMCYLTFPFIFAAIAVLGFLTIDELGCYSLWESSVITLSLLLGTSLLNYAQVHQENDLLLLATISALYFGLKWARSGDAKLLVYATISVAASLLIRLPAIANAAAVVLVLVVVVIEKMRHESTDASYSIRQRIQQVLTLSVPILILALVIDRAYQVYRFGWHNILTTYFTLWMRDIVAHKVMMSIAVQPNYPFGNPFMEGFFGVFTAPDASVFIYDPLLVLAVVGAIFTWRRLTPPWKAMLVSFSALLVCLAAMLARLSFWAGHSSWGDRYTTVPVEILAMTGFAICLLAVRNRPRLRLALFGFLIFSVLIQVSSLVYTVNLEAVQAHEQPTCVPIARIVNIKKALMHQPLLAADNPEQEMTEIQLLPFRSSRKLPSSILIAVRFFWVAALVAWVTCLARLVRPFKVSDPAST